MLSGCVVHAFVGKTIQQVYIKEKHKINLIEKKKKKSIDMHISKMHRY